MGEAVVTIDTMDWTGFEGGPPPLTNVSVLPDMSTEDTINTYYKNSDQLSTEDVQFGENISTKVTYFSEYIDGYNERTVYLTEMNSVTVVVSEGNNEELAKKNTTQKSTKNAKLIIIQQNMPFFSRHYTENAKDQRTSIFLFSWRTLRLCVRKTVP